jgi:hypothetical protein
MRYTCQACVHGEHKLCAGRQAPPPGMFGGSECDCDGRCGERPKVPDPQIDALSTLPREFRSHSGSNLPVKGGQEQVGESDGD